MPDKGRRPVPGTDTGTATDSTTSAGERATTDGSAAAGERTAPDKGATADEGAAHENATTSGSGADGARALLEYLRDLARARRGPVRGLAACDQVHWLADLPGEVYVETDAGPGDVLFSIPVIPLTPPGVLEEFDGWLGMRHWYRALHDMAEDAADGAEVVLATGLLSWAPPGGPAVHDHLLATPVRVVADDRSGRLDVVLAGPAAPRDRDLLTGLPGFLPDRTDWVWDTVRSGQGLGLNASVTDVLRKWCAVAFEQAVAFREDWAPVRPGAPAPPVPRLRLAPALVARPPGGAAVAEHLGTLAGLLDDVPVPGGLARFLEPGGRSPLLHVRQRDPETVAGLLGGMLNRGRRVLVAVQDAEAARGLRASLPEGVAGLCATATVPYDAITVPHDAATAPPDAVGGAVRGEDAASPGRVAAAILDRLARHDPARHDAYTAELAARHEEAQATVDDLTARLRTADKEERHDLGGGYTGTRGDLERRLRAEEADHGWLPPRPGLGPAPLTRAEAADLVRLLAGRTPARQARAAQRDVDPATLPSPPYVRTLVEAEAAAVARAERTGNELARRLRSLDVHLLARLEGCAGAVNAALRELGLEGHPGGWDPADHAVRAFADALARRRPAVWQRVAEMAAQAEWADRGLRSLAGHRVEFPPGEPHLREVAAAAQQLRAFLADGGTLKRGPLRSAPQRQAEPYLQGITVDGRPPVTPEALDAVFTEVMVRMACQELQYVWEAAGVSFPADAPLQTRVARFRRAHARLERVRSVLPAVDETVELLHRAGLGVQLTHPLQWYGYVTALESARLDLGADRAAADIAALRDAVARAGGEGEPPPELRAAVAAIDGRDADAYGRCLRALAEARHERALEIRCADLLDRLRGVHPELADRFAAAPADRAWPGRVERWDEAWAWAAASAAFAALPRSGAGDRLRADLDRARAHLDEVGAQLAAAEAWGVCLPGVDPASTDPAEIVPVWIAPLWRIPEVLAPRPDAFDVVIVDGVHDAGAEALFLLWYAPRVVLVGEGGPDLPPPEGAAPRSAPPPGLEEVVTPTATLFRILLTRFASGPPAAAPGAERPAAPPAAPTARPPSVPAVSTPSPPGPARPEPSGPARREPPPSEPPAAAERPPPEPPRREPARRRPRGVPKVVRVRPGRSIAVYRRSELLEIVEQVALREPDLDDDALVDLVARLLDCPADEALLVGARVRYAVQQYRESLEE